MIPVYQDRFFQPGVGKDMQRGNCWSACIASILELPLPAVPNFVEIEVLGGPSYWTLTYYYLYAMGLTLYQYDPCVAPAGKYVIASGLSPRSTEENEIYHAVVYKDGRLAHDPVPEGEGFIGGLVKTVYVIGERL